MKRLLFVVIVLILAACSSPAPTKAPTKAPVVSTKVCPEILEKTGSVEYGYLTIEGTVKNTCDYSISYVELIARAYNSSGTEVGSDWSYADSTEMSAGAESQFSIMIKVPSGTKKFSVKIQDWNE